MLESHVLYKQMKKYLLFWEQFWVCFEQKKSFQEAQALPEVLEKGTYFALSFIQPVLSPI
jgi:hypothetical protein